MLAACARHCCVCRRFRPLYLQVHHIIEQARGGSHELDNLIAVCVTCHLDVHTQTRFTRRFTQQELKRHRDAVVQLVADGKLPAGESADADLLSLSSGLLQALQQAWSASPPPRPPLSPAAVELLLAASGDGSIIENFGADAVQAGDRMFGGGGQRDYARYHAGVQQLLKHELIEMTAEETFYLTDAGYTLADDLAATAHTDSDIGPEE
jgi:hypothetical protein